MANDLTPIIDKVKSCIRLLDSSEGETLAATRALVRTLKSAGLDLHDLANSIGTANGKMFTEEQALEIYQHGVIDGRQAAEREAPVTFHTIEHEDPTWHEIACECARHPDRMYGDHELEFVNRIIRKTVRGGEPSEKEARWLRFIYARVR
jgi:hypothetical protein